MLPDSILVWKWRTPGYRSKFEPWTVNILARMVRRHVDSQVRVVCVTDDAAGIDPSIDVVALPDPFPGLQSPHGPRWPSCYRRLQSFAPDAWKWAGNRFLSVDLDTVVVADLAPILDRPDDFVGWQDPNMPRQLCGSMFMLTAGTRPGVWDHFHAGTSPAIAKAGGFMGSDQAWISFCLGQNAARWTRADGIVSFRADMKEGALPLPADARLVMFHGRLDPWGREAQRLDWVREDYR